MKTHIKILFMTVIVANACVSYAQTSDSSDASNSDKSSKVRHGGVLGATASYTVHDGEVRSSGAGNANNAVNTSQTARSTGANNGAQPDYSDSANQKNSQDMPTNSSAPDMTTSSKPFCWGWLGLLGLLGLGGLIKRSPDRA